MVDRLTPARRSRLMSRIRSRDTKPEMIVRSVLHRRGFRYKLHDGQLPGRPDLVFKSRRKVIFVHGCYWHGHHCKYGRAQSKSNVRFWRDKLSSNKRRDKLNLKRLRRGGWETLTIWECSIKKGAWLKSALDFLNKN